LKIVFQIVATDFILIDELAAYKKTVTLDKAAYQRLAVKHQQSIEERDNAIVKYAISEGRELI